MSQTQGIRIGRILGIPIYLDFSWILIFGLITFSLEQQFTKQFSRWSTAEHWGVGIATSVLFFASVVFHELAHSVVAQHYKIKVLSITLFLFGGLIVLLLSVAGSLVLLSGSIRSRSVHPHNVAS